MKYLLFAGWDKCFGGWRDYMGVHPSIHEARAHGERLCRLEPNNQQYDWYHVVDVESKEIILKGSTR